MTEILDASQFLPRSVSIINAYRLQHGDLTGHINNGRIASARACDGSIASYLRGERELEDYHVDMGLDFMELRRALFRHLDAKTAAFSFYMGDMSLKKSTAIEIYDAVRKGVGGGNEEILVMALAPNQTDPKFSISAEKTCKIREAFCVLVKVMDEVLADVRAKSIAIYGSLE